MRQFFRITRADYLQYTRSYAFLLTLALTLYAAYSFVPASGASYRTLRIGQYVGVNNAAWTAYVMAMMTSIFLSFAGFFLVNSNIKKDITTGVGLIIATTSISNLSYLLTKAWSNFLILLSMMGMAMLMSILVFLLRSGSYSFEPSQFILPFLLITLPAIFLISAFAVVTEVFFYRYNLLVNIGFFILFMAALSAQPTMRPEVDFYGVREVTMAMQHQILNEYPGQDTLISMGFIFSKKSSYNSFEFNGIHWPVLFLLSRLMWMFAALVLLLISSRFFHRFDISTMVKRQKKAKMESLIPELKPVSEIKLNALPRIKPAYEISPLIQTELVLLFRKGPKWLWMLNLGGMVALIFSPLPVAHQLILPILWFLQVIRWSDIATKEKASRIHYFSFASYQPLTRLFAAQLIAGILLSLLLAFPLLIRYLILTDFYAAGTIFTGGIFIVLTAALLGMMTGGKKLFEILFFLCVYANLNKIPFTDYFGAVNHSITYLTGMLIATVCIGLLCFQWRKLEMKRL